ncbi:MAG: autotransporter domain-containing protein [Elusimicrobiota bacterium]
MIKKLFSVLCALALFAPMGRAQVLLEVTTNASDNSAGSLGAILNAPPANGLVIFSPFLSPVIAPTTLFNVAVPISLNGNQLTINFNGANGMTVNGGGVLGINGITASGITVTGGGTLSTSYSSISGLTLTGGTFQTQDNSFTAGAIISGAGLGTNNIDVFGNNPTMSGIAGGGDLTVIDSSLLGNGILTLNGVNTFTGATFVKSGTLQLGINSALVATGNLTTAAAGTFDLNGFTQTLGAVTNAGTVKTGFGSLTAASYAGGGTLSVGLKSGLTNLVVTGAATLGGPLVVTGHPSVGLYTVVNAGTLAGQFSAITVPFGVAETIAYLPGLNGTAIIDILSDTPFTIAGQSSNQAAIGAALNAALTSGSSTGELASILNQMSSLTPAQTNAVLDQIGPVSYAALSGMSFAGSGVQSAAVNQRLAGLQANRASGDGARLASFNVSGGSSYPGTLVAELPGDATAAYMGDRDRLFDPGSPWGIFVSGLGTFNRLYSINGASGAQPGYSDTATGATLGVDYRFNEHFAAGVSGGYVNSFAKIDSNGGTVYGQSARLGVYGTVYNDEFHANLSLGGAHDFYTTSRNITALARTATASPAGSEFNLDALAGWDVKTAYAVVSPFLGLAYDRLMLGSFTEDGAGALNLAMAAQTAESLRSTLGVKLSRKFKPDWCDLTPYASAGWQHELDNQSRALTASLAGGTGSFTVNTADVSREAALLGAGLDMDWTPGFSMRFGYQSTLRTDFSAKTVNGSMRWRF